MPSTGESSLSSHCAEPVFSAARRGGFFVGPGWLLIRRGESQVRVLLAEPCFLSHPDRVVLLMSFYVYILHSETSGKTYVGQSADLVRRLEQHNDPDCLLTTYTKKNQGPWRLIHSEVYASRAEAMRRERELKTGKGRDWIRRFLLEGRAGGC